MIELMGIHGLEIREKLISRKERRALGFTRGGAALRTSGILETGFKLCPDCLLNSRIALENPCISFF